MEIEFDEQPPKYEIKVVKYFNRELKEGTNEYDIFQNGDL